MSRKARRLVTLVLSILAGLLLLVTGLMLVFERRLLYVPFRALESTPADYGLAYEDAVLTAEDGVRIHAWWLPAREGALAVLLCHGNAGNVSHRLHRAALMQQRLGVSVLLFDYRGYGRSEGDPDEAGTYRDARAAYRFLTETKGRRPETIVLFGESLGAAVAAQLALEKPARALVLESPFTSIPDMARAAYPFLPPVGPLIRTRYETLRKIPALKMPLLVFHGDRDRVIPFSQGRRVFEAAPEPKRFFAIPGAGHNDTYVTGGDAYWRVWRELLDGL
jgi:fermentation-respiration switch protein FrsA (DUF1100 family)